MGALAQLSPSILNRFIAQLSPEQLRTLGLRRPATDAEAAQFEQSQQPQGAPADFGGPIFPNPEGIKVSEDTESGVPVTRLPQGVQFNRGNFTGKMPADVSNPPQAQLAQPTMQTVGMKSGPASAASVPTETVPVFAPDGTLGDIPADRLQHAVAAGAKPGVNILAPDGTKGVVPADRYVEAVQHGAKVAPFEEQEIKHPGFWASLGEDLKNMVPHLSADGSNAGEHWQAGRAGAAELQRLQDNANQAAADARRKQQGYSGTYRTVAPIAQGIGVNVPGMEQSAQEGDVGGVLGHAAAVPAVMAATEGIARGAPAATRVAKAAARTETAAKLAASAKVFGASAEELPVVGRVVKAGKQLGKLNDIWNPADATKENIPYAGEKEPPVTLTPSESEPFEGITSPQHEQAVASEAASATPETPAQILNKKATPAELEKALNDALGGKPLQKGVPLRQQRPASAPEASTLPEGFTPVESSVLKGYKYDPATQEFTAVLKNGQTYTHGEVTPAQVEAFQKADSQGAAWTKEIRNNSPLVAKVLNGKRVAVKPAELETSTEEVIPKSKAGMSEDLTDILGQSLKQVEGTKGGVLTNASPQELMKRWGVDEESLASGREQTRGMSPQETEASVAKLTEAYKKGQAVEPVMETRDAANNLIEVDGRARAIAAHRAGIKRIPIVVRRLVQTR